jgi:hypothetical protein
MTEAAFQSLGISDDTKEGLNRLVIGVATMVADHFRKRGSRLSSPVDFYGSRVFSFFRTFAICIWVKEKLGRVGQVAVGDADLLTRVEVARRKAWPAIEKCLLKFSIIVDLLVVTVLPSLSAVGSLEEVLLFSMDFKVSQYFLYLELQDANFCLKKPSFAFLTDCVYWFLTSLKSWEYSMLAQYTTGCFCAGRGQSGLE